MKRLWERLPERVMQVQALFDMYSPRRASRIAVWGLLLCAVGLLGTKAHSGSLVGLVPLFVLLWANRQKFLATVDDLLARHAWALLALPLAVFASVFVVDPPLAQDDLLRHIIASRWLGGYSDMYVYVDPSVKIGDPYWGFDRVAGILGELLSPRAAMWIIQLSAWLAFVCVFCAAGLRLVGAGPVTVLFVLAALVLSLQVAAPRLFLARPEMFLGIWALAAAAVKRPCGGLAWVMTGVALTTTYYLAPIYFAAAILLPYRLRARVLVVTVLVAFWLAFWLALEGESLWDLLLRPINALSAQSDGTRIGENVGMFGLLGWPSVLILLLSAVWGYGRPGADRRLLLLALYFGLPNQVRFASVIAPLVALFVLSSLKELRLKLPRHGRLAMLILATSILMTLSARVARDGSQPAFHLPDDAVVLTAFDLATYSLPFENPGRIRVAPIFDIGMVGEEARTLVKRLADGGLDCDVVTRLDFTHVVERSLNGKSPECTDLIEVQGAWRLWRVRRPTSRD